MQAFKKQILRIVSALPPRWQCWIVSARSSDRVLADRSSFIHKSVQILGKRSVKIGKNTVISQDCWLNVNHRDQPHKSIEIGDHCFIGRRNFFSSGHVIRIHDFVLTANDCQFLGSTHVADDPMQPIITTGTTASDSIVIGTNTFIGAGARIIGDVVVGHGCVIGAGAVVLKSVPPFSKVVGSPASVRARYSMRLKRWMDPADFTPADEQDLPAEAAYVALLREAAPVSMPYLAAGSDMGNC